MSGAVSQRTMHLTGIFGRSSRSCPPIRLAPAVLPGRLAVAHFQGQGLGGIHLADALKRTSRAEFGVFAMVVDAKDEATQHFYEHHGFKLLPGETRRLCLPIAAVRKIFPGKPGH